MSDIRHDESDRLLQFQCSVLELVANREPLQLTLDALCSHVESCVTDGCCSVMRLDATRQWLYMGSAPCLVKEVREKFNGLIPSDLAGSCGTAVYTRKPVYVADIATDPRWASLKDLAAELGLKACWSYPILRDGGKEAIGSFAVSRSVTGSPGAFEQRLLACAAGLARMAIEADEMLSTLQRAQKMETIGAFAGGVAHDFNNLLTVISGNVHLALADARLSDLTAEHLHIAANASAQAAELVQKILRYAGREPARPRRINIEKLVRETVRILEKNVLWNVVVDVRVEPGLGEIQADESQLTQVFMNLLTNSAEAITDPDGVIRIGLSRTDDDQLRIEIADTGCGMDGETRRRAFDPFYSTRGEGRGLGLSTVQGIVRSNRGAIRLAGDPESGTRITITLPDARPGTWSGDRIAPREPLNLRGLRILVVDDESAVRNLVREVLTEEGIRVDTSDSGEQMLEMLVDPDPRFDLVLLDLSMPGMGGLAAYQQAIQKNASTSFVIMTGYSQDQFERLMTGLPGRPAMLQKPFLPNTLLDSIRSGLSTWSASSR